MFAFLQVFLPSQKPIIVDHETFALELDREETASERRRREEDYARLEAGHTALLNKRSNRRSADRRDRLAQIMSPAAQDRVKAAFAAARMANA